MFSIFKFLKKFSFGSPSYVLIKTIIEFFMTLLDHEFICKIFLFLIFFTSNVARKTAYLKDFEY
jgi:hypothetical protein